MLQATCDATPSDQVKAARQDQATPERSFLYFPSQVTRKGLCFFFFLEHVSKCVQLFPAKKRLAYVNCLCTEHTEWRSCFKKPSNQSIQLKTAQGFSPMRPIRL